MIDNMTFKPSAIKKLYSEAFQHQYCLELSRTGSEFKCVRYSLPWEPEIHSSRVKLEHQ